MKEPLPTPKKFFEFMRMLPLKTSRSQYVAKTGQNVSLDVAADAQTLLALAKFFQPLFQLFVGSQAPLVRFQVAHRLFCCRIGLRFLENFQGVESIRITVHKRIFPSFLRCLRLLGAG